MGSEMCIRDRLNPDENLINLACVNARSLVEKIDSLITLFEENQLHFALLTETWLDKKHCPPRTMSDLTIGANMNFIRRDRGSRGGGVAVVFNPTKIRMNRFQFVKQQNDNTELVCSLGNCALTKRKIAAMSIYLPPGLTAAELALSLQTLIDCTQQILTKHPDAIIFIGGDFNNKNMSVFCAAFPAIKPIRPGATRGNACLDDVYTNMHEKNYPRN